MNRGHVGAIDRLGTVKILSAENPVAQGSLRLGLSLNAWELAVLVRTVFDEAAAAQNSLKIFGLLMMRATASDAAQGKKSTPFEQNLNRPGKKGAAPAGCVGSFFSPFFLAPVASILSNQQNPKEGLL